MAVLRVRIGARMRYCEVEGRHAFSSMRAAHAWYVSSALPHDASHPFSSKSFGSTTSTSRGTNMPPYLHARGGGGGGVTAETGASAEGGVRRRRGAAQQALAPPC